MMTKLLDQTTARLPGLPVRDPNSHKGDFGRALLVGGSRGMSGAIALAGRATLRSGAGLVTLAVPSCVQDVVAAMESSYMTHALPDDDGHIIGSAADDLLALADMTTAVALGPGLGRSPSMVSFAERLYREVTKPMVVDADALVALAERPAALAAARGPRILTPHPGEFARLTGKPYDENNRVNAAATLANQNIIVVLKGHHTVVTDGTRFGLNQTGNPGMATGGSGDVLTGVIVGLLCQGLTPFDAARLSTHIHGLAGDLAAAELGQVSLIASDLIKYLPRAFQSLPPDR